MNYKNTFKSIVLVSIASAFTFSSYAGNKDRVGESGASELKINPWAASSGLANSNTSSVIGVEAMNLNVSGLAFVDGTQINFVNKSWLSGSGISLRSLGFGQRTSETSVFGISVTAMGFGEIQVTTVDQPEVGLQGTYQPTFLNIGLSFAKEFSNSIYGGGTVRMVSEQIANAGAQGIALDAGIRYVTGDLDRIKFGISLRNIGPKMVFKGDGFSERVIFNEIEYTLEQRAQGFEMPALLNIGASYDFHLGSSTKGDTVETELAESMHIITASGNFQSNSFGKDVISAGLEYGFRKQFLIRVGYSYEDGQIGDELSSDLTNAYTGLAAGASVNIPLGSEGKKLGVDYAYRTTIRFAGTHSIGLRIDL